MSQETTTRVISHTDENINHGLRNRTKERVSCYRTASEREIDQRLRELDQEWNIERTLEANAASLSLIGLTLGTITNRKWLALPAVVAGFLLQHAVQGWCPPVPVLRRMGFRTPREIENERQALKIIRGDYKDVSEQKEVDSERLLEAAER